MLRAKNTATGIGTIGYLVPEFPTQTHVLFWREIQALRALGANIKLLSTRMPDSSLCPHAFAKQATAETCYVYPPTGIPGIRHALTHPRGVAKALTYVAKLTDTDLSATARLLALALCAAKLAGYCDKTGITHIHGHSCADAAHLLAMCRLMGGPAYSLTLHGDLVVYGKNHREKMTGAKFVSVVGSHLLHQIIADALLPKERVWVTCMGIESERLGNLPDKRCYVANRLNMVTVARLNPAKGHIHALAALREMVNAGVDARYTIAGGGDYRATLESHVHELHLSDRVDFVGTQSEEEVMALLTTADVFVLPSTGSGEAWPVSVMEAMACGTPVVSTIIGATGEMITDGVDGLLVPQKDELALTAALLKMAKSPDLRRSLGEHAKVKAARDFNVISTANKLLEAIADGRT